MLLKSAEKAKMADTRHGKKNGLQSTRQTVYEQLVMTILHGAVYSRGPAYSRGAVYSHGPAYSYGPAYSHNPADLVPHIHADLCFLITET